MTAAAGDFNSLPFSKARGARVLVPARARQRRLRDWRIQSFAHERYAHLLPDSFREAEFGMLKADLAPGGSACSYLEATRQERALLRRCKKLKILNGPVAQVDRAAVS